ncbi:cytochrome P450 [Apodospora peruviana]|uniref:Cytochrome P450 n=1 Tax=Apodospora peruviana TaxID=516989 RepID=A0AAE0ME59_9PEZI|nr:cytochrome P450 [Apodospora peruviana]
MGMLDILLAIAKYTALAVVPLALYVVSVWGYRLAFDPLKEYPGPFAARVTHGYAGLKAFKKRLHLDTYHDHLKYGPVFRVAPDRLVFNTVTALDDILLNPRVTKGRPYLGARLNPTPSLFDTLDQEQHRQKRKTLDPVVRILGRKRILRYRRVLQAMIRSRMARPKDDKQDLYAAAAGEEVVTSGEKALRGTELWSEATFLMAAGASTISSLLAAAFFYLSCNPEVYKRLATEIRTTFSSGLDIRSGPQLGGCRYLRAVIDETLRISPASIGTLWRQQDPSFKHEPFVVDGHAIPPGVAVGISPYSLLHNEAYFPEPFTFRPERFLELDKTEGTVEEREARATTRHAFAPFALGDRNCAGRALAYMEASLTLAKTIWYFDFQRAAGEAGQVGGGKKGAEDGRDRPDEFQLYDNIAADHDGPNLVFAARREHWRDLLEGE